MKESVDMNIAAEVVMLLARLGVRDARCLRIYQDAVRQAIEHETGGQEEPDWSALPAMLQRQLVLLETSLRDAAARRSPVAAAQSADADPTVPTEDKAARNPARRRPLSSGHAPEVRSMEEKLHDERLPIQQLLREDCVHVGLIDPKTAERLVGNMTGKTSRDAELEIVEHLRQHLQDQVKGFIRKAKGGPWGDPRTQEDLRKDIHAARSVRSVLMLARQVVKEYQTWEQEHGRHGILGLFSPRRKLAR